MIFSENRYPLFGIMLYCWSMIFSENRYPLFGIMLSWDGSEVRILLAGQVLAGQALAGQVRNAGFSTKATIDQ